jgi:hypothetical protein
MEPIKLNIYGKTLVSGKVSKDEIIECLANIVTQVHRADNVRTSGSEFKHKIRTITKEGRLLVNSLMFDETLEG